MMRIAIIVTTILIALGSLPFGLAAMARLFELTILLAAVGTVIFLMLLNNLPQLYHPCFNNERFARVTDDRFFIIIEAKDPKFYRAKTEQLLSSLGASTVEEVEA